MLASSIPIKFLVPFANSAVGGDIRAIPLTSADPDAASLQAGFPPNTFLPITSGGSPPDGRDFNGLFNQDTAWAQWQAAGNPAPGYDSTFSTSIGGYPAGAVLSMAGALGYFWLSLVDNNTSDPDTGGANWQQFSLQSPFTTGDVKMSFKTTADPGWIPMNDGTIGDASSGSTYANASALSLFTLLYNNVVDAWAPVQTSSGGATTRGAQGTAATAWAAHCRLVLPAVLGRALASAGAGSGLTSRALGQVLGEETHLLTTTEIPAHTHIYEQNTNPQGIQTGGGGNAANWPQNALNTGSTGGGAVHNNMQPTSFLNVFAKL